MDHWIHAFGIEQFLLNNPALMIYIMIYLWGVLFVCSGPFIAASLAASAMKFKQDDGYQRHENWLVFIGVVTFSWPLIIAASVAVLAFRRSLSGKDK